MKRAITAALAVLAVVWFFCPASHPHGVARDFNAFYCAGRAVSAGVDPYRAEPLGTCERAPKKAGFYTVPAGVTLPAPLPPYDLAVFATIGKLPYEVATGLWIVLILASLAAPVEAIHRLTQLPRSVLLLVFGPIDGWSAIFLGEIAPVAVASLSVAMLAMREGHPRLSAALLGLSLCEPHVGIAPVLAMFACIPRTRPTIALSVLALIAVSFVSVGTATTFEYVRNVLPAHAVSEIASTRQLSLTALLHTLGVRDANALMLGSLSYVAMLLVGLVTARRLAARDPDDPLVIAAPAAFVLLGGVFIHSIQMPAAFPAALVAYTRVSGRLRTVLGAAIVIIATPWMSFLAFGIIVPCIAFVSGALAIRLLDARPRVAFAVGIAAACYVYGLQLGLATGGPYPGPLSLPPIAPHDLAEVNWGENIRALSTVDRTIFDFARLPEWLSIAMIAIGLWFAARTSEPRVERATVRLRIGASR
ncbi:MAG: DUF2029 domain-containing protein [Candidatus Eremiobacteraeota bacterium]|nr:DUF2029 domain-containing protein [Candidatus Eremiobacteraeota bacterium]